MEIQWIIINMDNVLFINKWLENEYLESFEKIPCEVIVINFIWWGTKRFYYQKEWEWLYYELRHFKEDFKRLENKLG